MYLIGHEFKLCLSSAKTDQKCISEIYSKTWKQKPSLNYRKQGHLFISHGITIAGIVLCLVLQNILTHVKVRLGLGGPKWP